MDDDINFGEGLPYDNPDLKNYFKNLFNSKNVPGYDTLYAEYEELTDLLGEQKDKLFYYAFENEEVNGNKTELESILEKMDGYMQKNNNACIAHAYAGIALLGLKQFEEAEKELKKYFIAKPEESIDILEGMETLHLFLALSQFYQSKYCDAEQNFEKVLKTDSAENYNYAAAFFMAGCQFFQKKYAQAETNMKRYVKAQPEHDSGFRGLAKTQIAQQKYAEAEENLYRSLGCSEVPETYYLLGGVQLAQIKVDVAKKNLEKYASLAPEDWKGWFLLAEILQIEGKEKEANEHYSQRCIPAASSQQETQYILSFIEGAKGIKAVKTGNKITEIQNMLILFPMTFY